MVIFRLCLPEQIAHFTPVPRICVPHLLRRNPRVAAPLRASDG
jgi:hypothetical protein